MKKSISLILILSILLFIFSSCDSKKTRIEDHEWKMRYVMRGENDQVIIDAIDKEDSVYPNAKIVELTLIAKYGKLTLTDHTNGKTYDGTYAVESKTPSGTNYSVTIDGKKGYAGVAMTTYADGSQEPTLPITLEEHSIYFYAK